MGKLLRKKFRQVEWIKILDTDMWRLSDGDSNINSVLRLSYHNLPSNRKRCFAYCSIFPKGYTFAKDDLINFWMAEGLLQCCGSEKTEEELGNEIFNDLESISFFQQYRSFFGWYEDYFSIHDLVNDLAKSVSGEFCMQIEGARVEGFLERTRHICWSLRLSCIDKSLEPICELKGLRSLILQNLWDVLISKNVQRDLFSGLQFLRMLKIRNCGLSELVDEISNLQLLRYLDLSHTNITKLPDSICMLYNLQTLLLQGCSKLTELPSNFSKLVNLRHLELPNRRYCQGLINIGYHPSMKKMPKHIGNLHIGNLNNLQALPYFIVEEQNESDLKDLKKLNHLHGAIHIKGLGNVIDPADVATTNLKDKKHLEELHLTFNGTRKEMDGSRVECNVSVFEALQPNSNLNRLTIIYYNGSSFPNWLSGFHLSNLVSLNLKDCVLCSHLPMLGQFPSLKEISISNCNGIKIISEEFYNNSTTNVPFRSLEVLKWKDMVNWDEWFCLEGFPLLKELTIRNCPKLKKALLPQHLPSLQKLELYNCEQLKVSVPKGDNIRHLEIIGCDSILVNALSSSLKRFVLRRNRYTEFSVEQSLIYFTLLEKLELDFTGFVKCTSLDLRCYDYLRNLSITGWRFSSLSFSLHLFTKLHDLYLYDCPVLESFPMGGLPSNLSFLYIENCPKLIGSREEWGLFQLNFLKHFIVGDYEFENVESFPEENLLPPTLEFLNLNNCSKLRKMNNKGFLYLKSLKTLVIENCPSLESLPEEDLPNSLYCLSINNCKKLEVSAPKGDNIRHLEIIGCDSILVNALSSSLKRFVLRTNRYTEFSVEQSLINFTLLEKLELDFTGFVECPSLDLRCYDSLESLSIKGWGSSYLPFSPHLFTKLHRLKLYNCPELELFPMGGLPSNLSCLTIENCPKLIGSREEWGLFQLNSLVSFHFGDEFENVESFPEENLLPSTLESLYLNNCSKLRIINYKGFLYLKSLKFLDIVNCPSLERLPEKEALPNSLSYLSIDRCPVIKEKYEKERGERWHTISHIPYVEIDRIRQE